MNIIFNVVLFMEFLFHGYCVYVYCSAVFKEKKSGISPLLLYLCASGIEFIIYKTFYLVIVNMVLTLLLTAVISFVSYKCKIISCLFHAYFMRRS